MKPSKLIKYLSFAIPNKFAVLVTGRPGIGKSDIIESVAKEIDYDFILDHPVVSDPTDYKGLPYAVNAEEATFLAYRNLKKAITAERPTIFFSDDLGQAPASVQASMMQLLLARQIGHHKVSEHVTFIAATNRKEDKAGVTGMLAPIKSRFLGGIIGLDVDHKDWVQWALTKGNMPLSLIAFIRFRPDLIDNAQPESKDLVNVVSPRTIAAIGAIQNAGLAQEFEAEVFAGQAGSVFASEYCGFLKMMRELPTIDEIVMNPTNAKIPKGAGNLYALTAALATRMTDVNQPAIMQYLERIQPEFRLACLKDAVTRKPELAETREYIKWSVDNEKLLNI